MYMSHTTSVLNMFVSGLSPCASKVRLKAQELPVPRRGEHSPMVGAVACGPDPGQSQAVHLSSHAPLEEHVSANGPNRQRHSALMPYRLHATGSSSSQCQLPEWSEEPDPHWAVPLVVPTTTTTRYAERSLHLVHTAIRTCSNSSREVAAAPPFCAACDACKPTGPRGCAPRAPARTAAGSGEIKVPERRPLPSCSMAGAGSA